jgi:hypothetical protein
MVSYIKKYHFLGILFVVLIIAYFYYQENNIIEMINDFVPLITVFAIVVILLKLNDIKEEVEVLKEITKNTKTIKMLNIRIDEELDLLNSVNYTLNSEMNNFLYKGVEKSKYIFMRILDKDFKISNKDVYKLKENIYQVLKTLKKGLKIDELNIKNTDEFLQRLEDEIIIQQLNDFILNLLKICKEERNGERRKKYENICVSMVYNIKSQTIDLYNEFQRVSHKTE